MAMVLQLTTFLHQYLYSSSHHIPPQQKSSMALRLGVLGASALINAASIIHPVQTHHEVIIAGFASRDVKDARRAAEAYGEGVAKVYESYEALLDAEEIEAVYIPLPNGLHFEWAMKALAKNKHVLLEKPATSNADQARELFALAASKNLVCLEAFHWQFHPAAHALKAQLDSGEHGKILRTDAFMATPAGSIPKSDIRWKYDLAGGALMDMAYVISSTRYFLSASTPTTVLSAHARVLPSDERVDSMMEAQMLFGDVESHVLADMEREAWMGVVPRVWEAPSIEVETEGAVFYYYNFMMPHLYHYITVKDKRTGLTTTQKHYSGSSQSEQLGEPWWSTYRWQLEAFVDKVRGREPVHWVTGESSVAQMETIDMIYEKAGLPKRP